jgi:CubicO group peptidase (beta-lactamase class C family)
MEHPLAFQRVIGTLCASFLFMAAPQAVAAPPSTTADELVGLWKAKQRFGPDARGPLTLQRTAGGWTADFLGRTLPVRANGSELSFELGNGEGSFRGRAPERGSNITGQWTAPNSRVHGFKYAAPVILKADGPNRWRGEVTPRDDEFTLYLMVQKRADGTLGAFMRNPERNIGVFYNVDHLTRDGPTVQLVGTRRGTKEQSVLLSGTYDAENELLSVAFPERGGTYDFRRDDEASGFYPRGKNPGRYMYRPPPARDDGWPVATPDEVDMDRAGIEKFIQMIVDTPMDSLRAPMIEGILVARHGKLVLEEYFHNEHRDKLHETRSAAKSMTATIVGAAMQAGAPLDLSTPVYKAMNAGVFPADLEPQKRAMTLEHLLMMRAGFFCDDSNDDAPGNEDVMLEQKEEPDLYHYSLRVPQATPPGEKSVYCSMMPNLAVGMVERTAGEPVLDLFDRLIASPMKIATYAWPLDPVGHPYGGGGARFLPRDFMKLGQLMLNGGTWQGRRILSRDFVQRASSPLHDFESIQYGYLWWSMTYAYKDRTLRAFFAGGNGGQVIMVIPDLDLVVAAYGANYNQRVGFQVQEKLVPDYILPAVREGS